MTSLYATLAKHQWMGFWRSWRERSTWMTALVITPAALYVSLVLVLLAVFFTKLFPASTDVEALALLNEHMLTALFSLFALRFFFQRPPRLTIQPYLHLPLKRLGLVRYFQVSSLASVHNLFPLLFVIPFWARHADAFSSPEAAMIWTGGLVLCLLASHYMNTWVRLLLDIHPRLLAVLAGGLIGLQIADLIVDGHLLPFLSTRLFDPLSQGNLTVLGGLAVFTLGLIATSTRALLHSLRKSSSTSSGSRQQVLPVALGFGTGTVRNLLVFELKMMARNRRARQYVVISVVVSTFYTALLLSDYNPFFGSLMAAITGLFASGVFALNYGQLMFAWESVSFDGLLSRPVTPQQMILAKLFLLMVSCLILFLLSLPLFAWLAPELTTLHVAFLFYNAGVTSVLMLTLAVRNRKRIDPSRGSFFHYEGFSMLHWLWVLPTITPPAVLLFVLRNQPATAYSIIALTGLISMLLAWPWSLLLARQFEDRKHTMAAGFRRLDR